MQGDRIMDKSNTISYNFMLMDIDRSDITLRHLEILRAVIRFQTTVGAASQLGLSQPAVSNAVKIMETRLGFALFERINSRLYPTEEALTIYNDSEPIFTLHASLRMRVQDLRENRAGILRIMATPPLAYSIVPPALKGFLLNRSKVRVSLDVRRSDGVVESVENNIAELGFVLGLINAQGVNSEILHRGSMVCVFKPGHPLNGRSIITPKDLVGERLIALERDTSMGASVRRSFETAGVPFDYSIEVRYCNAACVLAENGLGVAIVDPFTVLFPDRFNLEVRPFEPQTDAIASVLWSRTRPLSRLATAFIKQAKFAITSASPSLKSTKILPHDIAAIGRNTLADHE
jgi:DNA-binding transcriptional LysR family regulator